jgi:tripartite ATP-independent transporter DctM subunit
MLIFSVITGFMLLILGIPIFMVFVITGGLVTGVHLGIPWSSISQQVLDSLTKYMLLAIPLYILAANIMVQGGLSQRLVGMFISFVRHFKGGLALALVMSIALFSAISGSILASIVAIGGIMIPIMVRHGYSKPFAAAMCAAVAGIDALIPPSNIAIIYSAITGVSVGKTFMAGLIPGIFQAIVLVAVSILMVGRVGIMPAASWKERWLATYSALPVLAMPVMILGGIYTGLFSPVEAAAVACVYALLVSGFIYRELTLHGLWDALKQTVETTATIFGLIAAASFLSVALAYTRVPQQITEVILAWGVSPLLFLFAAALVWLILGTFLEAIPNIYLTVPIAFPVATVLHVDLLQLYVTCCVFVGIGLITPPVCVGAYTAAAVAGEPPERVIRHLFPVYTLVLIACGLVYMLIPQFSTWIPGMMK